MAAWGATLSAAAGGEKSGVTLEGESPAGVIEDIAFRGGMTHLRVKFDRGDALRAVFIGGVGNFALGQEAHVVVAPKAGVLFLGVRHEPLRIGSFGRAALRPVGRQFAYAVDRRVFPRRRWR